MNAAKGADKKLKGDYPKHGLPEPILLKNKWQVRKEKKTSAEDADSDEDNSDDSNAPVGGGTKLCSLTGAEFNYWDEKKGLHRLAGDWFQKHCGHAHVFPDTSNTRYCSYCKAAVELLIRCEYYIQFLQSLSGCKKDGLNNMEANILAGLRDWPTLTELAILALYGQVVSVPYISYVQSYEGNALNLGPFREQLMYHIRRLIADPDLLLNPDTFQSSAVFLGGPPERLDVFYKMSSMLPNMPNLRILLVEYLTGAMTIWERFTQEFAADGDIAKATLAERDLVSSEGLNNRSESAVGACKQAKLRNPTLTDSQRNSIFMRRYNGSERWKDFNLDEETLA